METGAGLRGLGLAALAARQPTTCANAVTRLTRLTRLTALPVPTAVPAQWWFQWLVLAATARHPVQETTGQEPSCAVRLARQLAQLAPSANCCHAAS